MERIVLRIPCNPKISRIACEVSKAVRRRDGAVDETDLFDEIDPAAERGESFWG